MRSAVHFVPLVTTVFALVFAIALFRRWRERGGTHLVWWGIGMLTYAAGTLTESLTTLFGWQEPVFRAWYIAGALLGGMPLAQGSVYLHLTRRTAHAWTALACTTVVVAATFVLLSPISYDLVEPYRLSGRVLTWSWVRLFSPFLNTYAVVFLVGGAVVSAVRFRRDPGLRHRFVGNVCIAIGGILPGIGGTFTRLGYVEVLYVTELIGLAFVYIGYRLNTNGALLPRPGDLAVATSSHHGNRHLGV